MTDVVLSAGCARRIPNLPRLVLSGKRIFGGGGVQCGREFHVSVCVGVAVCVSVRNTVRMAGIAMGWLRFVGSLKI